MATYKKPEKRTIGGTGHPDSADAGTVEQAERLARSLGESAQQVWLAGIGALGRAQSEGSKLFDALVAEGEQLEQRTRQTAGEHASEVKGAVESSVDGMRDLATGTWDRWEKTFDNRMQRALVRLGVPSRGDIAELNQRVEELTAELRRRLPAAAPRKRASRKAAAPRKAAVTGAGAAATSTPPTPTPHAPPPDPDD
ncbi:phasin family protein [Luteimonas sp. A277]